MWIEIFKTGTHTDSGGNTQDYSPEDLDRIASLYNTKSQENSSNEAPVVKGHPKTDDPAYGWVEALRRRGNVLMAKLKDLTPEFTDQIKQGMFKKVSIALYPDLTLRHIGFLGAATPAVEGLKPVTFAEDSEYMEFVAENGDLVPQEEKQPDIDQFAQLQSKLQTLESENVDLRQAAVSHQEIISRMQKETRTKEFRRFTDSLIDNPDGAIITPAQADSLVDIMEMAFAADFEQSNGNSFSKEVGNLEKVKGFVSSLRPVLVMSEFAHKPNNRKQFETDYSRRNVQPERLTLHEKAMELQSDDSGLTYEEAIMKVRRHLEMNVM